jgi:hypothetical protein
MHIQIIANSGICHAEYTKHLYSIKITPYSREKVLRSTQDDIYLLVF